MQRFDWIHDCCDLFSVLMWCAIRCVADLSWVGNRRCVLVIGCCVVFVLVLFCNCVCDMLCVCCCVVVARYTLDLRCLFLSFGISMCVLMMPVCVLLSFFACSYVLSRVVVALRVLPVCLSCGDALLIVLLCYVLTCHTCS